VDLAYGRSRSTQELIEFIFPGDVHVYNSKDIVDDDIGGSNEAVFADPEFLNSLKELGVPPYELVLKIGAICRLTRNFDASRGLTKNTRVIVRKLLRHTVEVETISCSLAGKVIDPVCEPDFSDSCH
jgi:hypothetical protein